MTLIDNILSSNPCGFLESGCMDVGVSDHLLVHAVKLGESCQGHKFRNVQAYRKCNIMWMHYWRISKVQNGKHYWNVDDM